MFDEESMVQEISGKYNVPEDDLWELVEYAHGNGRYMLLRHIARFIVNRCRSDEQIDYVISPIIDNGTRYQPTEWDRAMRSVMEVVEEERKQLNVPTEEFLIDVLETD